MAWLSFAFADLGLIFNTETLTGKHRRGAAKPVSPSLPYQPNPFQRRKRGENRRGGRGWDGKGNVEVGGMRKKYERIERGEGKGSGRRKEKGM